MTKWSSHTTGHLSKKKRKIKEPQSNDIVIIMLTAPIGQKERNTWSICFVLCPRLLTLRLHHMKLLYMSSFWFFLASVYRGTNHYLFFRPWWCGDLGWARPWDDCNFAQRKDAAERLRKKNGQEHLGLLAKHRFYCSALWLFGSLHLHPPQCLPALLRGDICVRLQDW